MTISPIQYRSWSSPRTYALGGIIVARVDTKSAIPALGFPAGRSRVWAEERDGEQRQLVVPESPASAAVWVKVARVRDEHAKGVGAQWKDGGAKTCRACACGGWCEAGALK